MAVSERKKSHKVSARPPFDCIALVLQGGGALGAYQCGVFQALTEADVTPDWIGGISIGGINAAIIAGNPSEKRLERLEAFWSQVTGGSAWGWADTLQDALIRGDVARTLFGQASANAALLAGAQGFFAPRMPPPWLQPAGTPEATSYYDTGALKTTLESLIDFDRLNNGDMRVSLGAVNVESGNFVYFDTSTDHLRVEHVMASAALPPGFPAVQIDGQSYWDGGLVSNTPLQWVVDGQPRDTLVFQVDLWSARGEVPRTLPDVYTREKEILYSSRTREQTDRVKEYQRLSRMLADLLDKLPPELREDHIAKELAKKANRAVFNIVHLIYRGKSYEGQFKDYEFSRLSMREHWRAGYDDAVRALRHPEIFERPTNCEGVAVFDPTREG